MSKPQVVLVHGAWGSPEMWGEVRTLLQEQGVTTKCADLPTTRDPSATLASDVEHVRGLIAGDRTVVVGHSYGGVVIGDAASDMDNVEHLVYVAAGMPDVGESMFDILQRRPLEAMDLDFFDDGTSLPQEWGADDGRYPSQALEKFAAIAPRRFAVAAALAPASATAWRKTPSTYIVATTDKVIHPDTQRELASQRATQSLELDCDHVAMFVHPHAIADAIAQKVG